MKIWLVGIGAVDGSEIRYVCLSKETALKRWEELRLELIEEANDLLEHCKREGYGTETEEEIIKNLSATQDPEKMDNYPQDSPFIKEMETED